MESQGDISKNQTKSIKIKDSREKRDTDKEKLFGRTATKY